MTHPVTQYDIMILGKYPGLHWDSKRSLCRERVGVRALLLAVGNWQTLTVQYLLWLLERMPAQDDSDGPSFPQTVVLNGPQCRDNSNGSTDGASLTCSERSSARALAQEVGLNAHEYMEECFYTEVGVLDRGKFDAIPQVTKTEFRTKVSAGIRRLEYF